VGTIAGADGIPTLFAANPDNDQDLPLVVGRCEVFRPVWAAIDVRPGDWHNVVDPRSTVPVSFAILSRSGFDATVTDPATVRVGSAPIQGASTAYVDGDKRLDFTAAFVPAAAGIRCRSVRVRVTATATYGWPIEGLGWISARCR
jgi:hypothetical protein